MTAISGMRVFHTEEELWDHAEMLNEKGIHPDVAIMDSNGHAMLACRTAPGGDGWGFAYYTPGEDGFMDCVHDDCPECGGPDRSDWKPTFPVAGLVLLGGNEIQPDEAQAGGVL